MRDFVLGVESLYVFLACLLDNITRGTIRGSQCTTVQVSIDKSLTKLQIQLKKDDEYHLQRWMQCEGTVRASLNTLQYQI